MAMFLAALKPSGMPLPLPAVMRYYSRRHLRPDISHSDTPVLKQYR